MTASDDIKTLGLKVTNQRQTLLELFRKKQESGENHLSAEDVYQLLQEDKSVSKIPLSTIYRALTQFEQAGLLIRHHFESEKAVFELNEGQHHDHLVCLQCGHIEEFYDVSIEQQQEIIAKNHGFTLAGHNMHLFVNCMNNNCPRRQTRG